MFKRSPSAVGRILDAMAAASFAISALAVLLRGRIAVAALLAVCAAAFFLRLTGRRNPPPSPVRPPLWISVLNGMLSIVIAAALVEATQLPVRFDQEGFAYWHWALVLALLVASYLLFDRTYRRLANRP